MSALTILLVKSRNNEISTVVISGSISIPIPNKEVKHPRTDGTVIKYVKADHRQMAYSKYHCRKNSSDMLRITKYDYNKLNI